MAINPQEWLNQAQYDLDTAQAMLDVGRNMYAVFMCHLAIEKALKALVHKHIQQAPPKIHSLVKLLKLSEKNCAEHLKRFLVDLDQASIATRYPEELNQIQKLFPQERVANMLLEAKEILEWVNETL